MNLLKYIFRFPLPFISDISVLIPFLLAFSKRKWLEPSLKYLFILLSITLGLNIIGIFTSAHRMNNLILFNLFLPIQFGIILKMFSVYLSKDYQKKALLIIFVFFMLIFILDFFSSNPHLSDLHNHRANKYSFVLQDILIIGLILYYFYRILVEITVPNLLIFPFFWICCGLLLSHAGAIFVDVFAYEMNVWENSLQLGELSMLPSYLEIIKNILFSVGLWMVKKESIV